jgi:hypothetical protein
MGLWDKIRDTGIFDPIADWMEKNEPNWDEIEPREPTDR